MQSSRAERFGSCLLPNVSVGTTAWRERVAFLHIFIPLNIPLLKTLKLRQKREKQPHGIAIRRVGGYIKMETFIL